MRDPSGATSLCKTASVASLTTHGRLQREVDECEQLEVHLRRHRRLSHRPLRGAHGLVGCERVSQRVNTRRTMQAGAGGRRTHTVYGTVDIL